MSKLIRYFAPEQYCFITCVTAHRMPCLDKYPDLLVKAIRKARRTSHFRIIAWVILPDHLHVLLHTPHGDTSMIVQKIKLSFALQYQRKTGHTGAVWQHRFWDHIIRSGDDMRRHIDYIHFNPVKHRLVDAPSIWTLSSYRKFNGSVRGQADVTDNGTFGE